MSFDGIRKTEEPKVPDGMAPIRLAVGYTKYGNPVALMCDAGWNGMGLHEKCEREHSYDEDDEEPDNSHLIPVGQVQRIMLFMPTQAPAAKVAKAMDISELMKADAQPVDVQMIVPDTSGAEESAPNGRQKYAWD